MKHFRVLTIIFHYNLANLSPDVAVIKVPHSIKSGEAFQAEREKNEPHLQYNQTGVL